MNEICCPFCEKPFEPLEDEIETSGECPNCGEEFYVDDEGVIHWITEEEAVLV